MVKIFLIFFIIALILFYLSSRISRFVRKFFSMDPEPGNIGQSNDKKTTGGEVLYKKDDVIVLKGEAQNKKDD